MPAHGIRWVGTLVVAVMLAVTLSAMGVMQQGSQVGQWRDTLFRGFFATMTITDLGDGKARIRSVYTDGSELVKDLREVSPRSTERRRWEEVGDEHSYAIRRSDGFLDIFDSQGHVRTAPLQK